MMTSFSVKMIVRSVSAKRIMGPNGVDVSSEEGKNGAVQVPIIVCPDTTV